MEYIEQKDNIFDKGNNIIQNQEIKENIYIHYFSFDVKYEIFCPILRDIQTCAQLIKLIKNHQISDIIFIKGNNSYTINSRFYFKYQNIIDFYIKVMDVIETDYFTKICYYIYRTKPKSKEFKINFLIFYNCDNTCKINVEIILKEHILSEKILKIIFNEFNICFNYILQAFKANKINNFLFSSTIIKNEFFVLTKIIQNIKLIEYIIKGKLNKFDNSKNGNENSFIQVNDEFKVLLNKLNENNIYYHLNLIEFKILLIKIKEDKMTMQIKVIFKNENKKNNYNMNYNVITICLRKLTANSTFVFIKYISDFSLNNSIINYINSFLKKCLNNMDKLGKTAKKF